MMDISEGQRKGYESLKTAFVWIGVILYVVSRIFLMFIKQVEDTSWAGLLSMSLMEGGMVACFMVSNYFRAKSLDRSWKWVFCPIPLIWMKKRKRASNG